MRGGHRGEVAQAVPHGNTPRFAQAIVDLLPSDGSVTPRCCESLRDRLIGAASVFDDLSRNELVEHLTDGLRMMRSQDLGRHFDHPGGAVAEETLDPCRAPSPSPTS